jgi:hypothetical protein
MGMRVSGVRLSLLTVLVLWPLAACHSGSPGRGDAGGSTDGAGSESAPPPIFPDASVFLVPDVAPACAIHLAQSAPEAPPSNPAPPIVRPPLPTGDPRQLSPAELANRLSRLAWGQPADRALIDAVAACPPGSSYAVSALIGQMLKDPRAHAGVQAFFTWWLHLDQIAQQPLADTIFPPTLRQAVAEEPARFGAHVVLDGDGLFRTLLDAQFSLLNQPLAQLYGVPGITGPDFVKVPLPPTRRGLLTQAALLLQGSTSLDTQPVRRGTMIWDRVLCDPIPFPLQHPEVSTPTAGQTRREWLAAVRTSPVCAGCHDIIDPMGLAFEVYDGIGRARQTDQGKPIDPAGKLMAFGIEGSFTGPIELVELLAKAPSAPACFATQWLEFAVGPLTDQQRNLYFQPLAEGFVRTGGDVRLLIQQIGTLQIFLAP